MDKNTMSQRGCFGILPTTTRLVPIKESNIVANLGFFSDSVLDAKRQKRVAMHSMIAPKRGETWNRDLGRKLLVRLFCNADKYFWMVLGGRRCMIRTLFLRVFSLAPTTSKIARSDKHSSRPLTGPKFLMRHHGEKFFLKECCIFSLRNLKAKNFKIMRKYKNVPFQKTSFIFDTP